MKHIDAKRLLEKIAEQMESLPREVGRGAGTITSKGQAFQIMRSIIDSFAVLLDEKTFDDYLKATPAERRKMNMTKILGAEKLAKVKETMEQALTDCNELEKISEKYAEKLDISKGWFDGGEIDDLIKESFQAGAGWQYQKDRRVFAKLRAKEWMSGYDAAISQFVKIPYTGERWFSTTDGEFIAGALFEEPIPANAELYYRKEDKK